MDTGVLILKITNIFLSQHVIFLESEFPFTSHSISSQSRDSNFSRSNNSSQILAPTHHLVPFSSNTKFISSISSPPNPVFSPPPISPCNDFVPSKSPQFSPKVLSPDLSFSFSNYPRQVFLTSSSHSHSSSGHGKDSSSLAPNVVDDVLQPISCIHVIHHLLLLL